MGRSRSKWIASKFMGINPRRYDDIIRWWPTIANESHERGKQRFIKLNLKLLPKPIQFAKSLN